MTFSDSTIFMNKNFFRYVSMIQAFDQNITEARISYFRKLCYVYLIDVTKLGELQIYC